MMQKLGTTWAGVLDRAERADPVLVGRVHQLGAKVDSDIYGRYVKGTLTREELEDFYRVLEEWGLSTLQLLKVAFDSS